MTPTLVMERILDPVGRCLTPEVARALVSLHAEPEVVARIDYLARKCNEGELTPEERDEYEACVHAIEVVSLLQARARAVLAERSPD